MSQADPRLRPSDAELQERLFVESRRYGEKRNVVDHVEDRAAFVQHRHAAPATSGTGASTSAAASRPGRRLGAVMREVAATPRLDAVAASPSSPRVSTDALASKMLRILADAAASPHPVPMPVDRPRCRTGRRPRRTGRGRTYSR